MMTGGLALEESVQVRVSGDGYIELTSATMAMGQGIVTSYAQLAVDVFGVPIDRIRSRHRQHCVISRIRRLRG
ncbi:MAG: molybdopterin-dependent oxidoreductase [Nitrospiraceae bacterium]|nr:molybdopterin-dependent oxidoreductase [Nitrospiraceae bacterium]